MNKRIGRKKKLPKRERMQMKQNNGNETKEYPEGRKEGINIRKIKKRVCKS